MNQAVMELINNPDRITDALNNVEPGSKLEEAMEKWENIDNSCFSFEENKWKMEGFITFFQECFEMMHAIDPSIPKALPAQCFDVEFIAERLGIPIEDFGIEPKVAEPELALTAITKATEVIADYVRSDKQVNDQNAIAPPRLESPYLNAQDASAYLQITIKSLYGIVERGHLKPLRGPKRQYRFTRKMLDDYLSRGS